MLAISASKEVSELHAIIAEKNEIIAAQAERIAEQSERILALEKSLETMRYQLDNLVRHRFGQRSEKDLSEGDKVENSGDEPADDIEFERIASYERRKRKRRQERLPESLPRVNVYYDIEASEKICSCGCGRKLRKMGESVTEEIVVVPEVIYIRRHIRPKYGGCGYDSQIITAPMLPSPIKKGLASAEMIAEIAINKYEDSLPLYRQQQRFARHHIELSRQTMCDWLAAGAHLIEPLVSLIKRYTLSNPIINTDDTPIPTLSPGNKKTKTGRVWVYAGHGGDESKDEYAYIFYEYSPDRQSRWAQATLSGYEGYVQADAYPGYDILYRDEDGQARVSVREGVDEPIVGKAIEVGCWMHARREFYNIAKHHKQRGLAYEMVQMIKKLYKIEADAKALNMTAEARYALRQKESVPVLEAIKDWLDEKRQEVIAKTPIAGAINYAHHQWRALCRYVEDGRLEIDNGYSERLVKSPCIGKKNFLFFGSDKGGDCATSYYTLIQSAKLYNLNSQLYLVDVVRRISAKLYDSLEELLPHRWKAFNPHELKGNYPDEPMIVSELMSLLAQTSAGIDSG